MEKELKPVTIELNTEEMVSQWAIYVVDRWVQALQKYHIGQTGDLQHSFMKELQKANGDVEAVIFRFLKYGRFVDMGVGRGQTLAGIVENRRFDRYRDSEGKMTGRLARKKKPWYTKTFYGQVAKLGELFAKQGSEHLLQVMESAFSNIKINLSV